MSRSVARRHEIGMRHPPGQAACGDACTVWVHLLMQCVDAEAEAMRQQGQPTALIEDRQIVPERLHHRQAADRLPIPHDARRPASPPRCLSDRALALTYRPDARMPLDSCPKQMRYGRWSVTSFRSRSVSATSGERPDRFTQRQRPMGRQLHDQPLGQWLQRPVVLILRQVSSDRLTTRHDDGSAMSGTVIAIGEITIIPLPRHRRISTILDRGSRQRAHPLGAHSRDKLPARRSGRA